jgi:hypothetical protein
MVFRIKGNHFHNQHQLSVTVMGMQYVFCDVETEFLSIIQMNFRLRVESKCLYTKSLSYGDIINDKKWGKGGGG